MTAHTKQTIGLFLGTLLILTVATAIIAFLMLVFKELLSDFHTLFSFAVLTVSGIAVFLLWWRAANRLINTPDDPKPEEPTPKLKLADPHYSPEP